MDKATTEDKYKLLKNNLILNELSQSTIYNEDIESRNGVNNISIGYVI